MEITRDARIRKRAAIVKRKGIVERIQIIHTLAVNCENNSSLVDKLLIAFEGLDSLWANFLEETEVVFNAMVDLDEIETFSSIEEIEANNLVISIKAMVKQIRGRAPLSVSTPDDGKPEVDEGGPIDLPAQTVDYVDRIVDPPTASSHFMRLPEIPLPQFEGDIHQWPVFRDRFVALVDSRANISNVEKFYYLLSCLGPEAEEVVKGITVSNDTYSLAWDALVERFDRPRRLASSIVDTLLTAPIAQQESVSSLNTFLNTFDENIALLKSLKLPDVGEFILFTIASRCLPLSSRRLFESANSTEYPNTQDLLKFVKARVHILENAGPMKHGPATLKFSHPAIPDKYHRDKSRKDKPVMSLVTAKPRTVLAISKCLCCAEAHKLDSCNAFKALTVDGRFDLVTKNRLCLVCFSDQHFASKCTSSCSICKRRHNTLLHRNATLKQNCSSQPPQATLLGMRSSPAVLLGTAVVFVRDSTGILQSVRALIDAGSQISAMTSSCSDRLGLRRSRWTASVTGLGGHCVPKVLGTVQMDVQSRYDTVAVIPVKAWVLPTITADMPTRPLSAYLRESCSHLSLADPNFDKPAPIELLLGADVYPQLWEGEQLQLGDGLPSAYHTLFGWVLIGPVDQSSIGSAQCLSAIVEPSIEMLMDKFWCVEEPEEADQSFTTDGRCESIFTSECFVDNSGRYSVPLLFEKDHPSPSFENTWQTALKRFEHLEQRLVREEALGIAYRQFMKEYESLGHMSVAERTGKYIIPHHAVCKLTTNNEIKLRVVFDASARCRNGLALNDVLNAGPKLQRDLIDVLLGFRLSRYTFSADICKMYRQILINSEYRPYQHILWRSAPTEAIREYELNTITYGINCAPFLAIRVLQDIAFNHCTEVPAVKEALLNQTYMDDICTGGDTLAEVSTLQFDLIETLYKFGFELKKWASNTPSVLDRVPIADRTSDSLPFSSDAASTVQVLGLKWNPTEDTLGYEVSLVKSLSTKRGVLSIVARIFDPLGFLAPVIFHAKNQMQTIWRSKLSWDDPLPMDITRCWEEFVAELPVISLIRIPRFTNTYKGCPCILCGFCDASEKGYAAVIYLRVVNSSGRVTVHLLGSKTKSAPINNKTTIPRLELCAAGLLARWLARVKNTLATQLVIHDTVMWTDSTIVLAWLTNPHVSFKIFVSNRVNNIHKLLPGSRWGHVKSENNPADCASRGLMPSELSGHSLYWKGPTFLLRRPDDWDINIPAVPIEEVPEIKVSSLLTAFEPVGEWFDRFSSYSHMLRVTARIRRFTDRCQRKVIADAALTRNELDRSLLALVKCSQRYYFRSLYRELAEQIPISSKFFARLAPFLDSNGVIRVGGRLRYSRLSEAQKHPILLAKSSHLSTLVARHWHLYACHAGSRLMTSLIAKRFWILSVRRVIGRVIGNCTICVKLKGASSPPIMADLPPARVLPSHPFSKVGIDYAGPLVMRELSMRKTREYKVYIAVFVCMTVKAVHLEIVTDLSTDAFLAAFNRFVSRRGLPTDIFSDCGTNFVGASTQFRQLLANPKNQELVTTRSVCSWHFNPPSAPHFGGLWEAAVRSMKRLLVRVMGNRTLTLEELTTVICRVEATLNSRPLTPMSSDPDDLEALTPGHFLIGRPLLSALEPDVPEDRMRLATRWMLLHQCNQALWKRWTTEYLNTLQQRSKWVANKPNIKRGDMVVIKNDQTPPLTWRLGRVTELLPGPDQVVRVAKVLTKQGVVTRPVVKLVLLPTA